MTKKIKDGTLEYKNGFITWYGNHPGMVISFECNDLGVYNVIQNIDDMTRMMAIHDRIKELESNLANKKVLENEKTKQMKEEKDTFDQILFYLLLIFLVLAILTGLKEIVIPVVVIWLYLAIKQSVKDAKSWTDNQQNKNF